MSRGGIDLGRNIYVVTAGVAWGNLGPFALATLLLVGTDVGAGYLHAPITFAVLRALILMIVAYSAYRMLLSGGAVRGWEAAATPDGRVPWRFVGVMLIILGPILFLGIVWTSPHSNIEPGRLADIVIGLVMVMCYAALYVLLGTALPEVAERGEVSLRAAFARGRARYREIAQAMMFGPWCFRAAALVAMVALGFAGVEIDPFSGDPRAFQPASLVPLLVFKASHVFAELMTAVVLVRAYRRSTPDRAAPPAPDAAAHAPSRG